MTDVPPDSGVPGHEPAPSDPPVVRRSNYAPPPPDAEPPRFDDDALAEAMAAEVRPYTEPITLPKLPVSAPVAEEPAPAEATPADETPFDETPSDETPSDAGQSTSTLEAIERLEQQLRLISSGEIPTQDPPAPPPAPAPLTAASDVNDDVPEPALDHPAPGHFFPAAFEPIAPHDQSPSAPILPEVDESLIDPAAAAELSAAAPEVEPETWWGASEPVDGAWDLETPDSSLPAPAEPAAAEPPAPEPPAAEPVMPEPEPPAPEPAMPEPPAAEAPAPEPSEAEPVAPEPS
ncbi:MAG: hypothetical protein ABIP33_01460, partial [Pseudolysinimonas sp.]